MSSPRRPGKYLFLIQYEQNILTGHLSLCYLWDHAVYKLAVMILQFKSASLACKAIWDVLRSLKVK